MIITLERIRKTGVAIDGRLYMDGSPICDTAENAEGCLPTGFYPIVRHRCKQYGRFVPMIVANVSKLQGFEAHGAYEILEPKCSECPKLKFVCNNTPLPCFCPQIKAGNGIFNRKDGSIIVGSRIAPGCLKLPKQPFENLCERLRKLDSRGSVTLLKIDQRYA